MKRMFVFVILIFCWMPALAQTSKLPYPVIFLHGLVSSDATWNQTVTALGGDAKVFDVCLNHDGNNATASLTSSDIYVIGWRDGTSTPSTNRLYVMNFDNSRFQAAGHSTHTLSNQAAIYKQGVALKAMIEAVLAIENCSKVILVGHSMGGLEIREYLQRGFDGTASGRGTNWVDQTSLAGHCVAGVVTTGTPHLGSNHTGAALSAFAGVDERSEACRDLRYPYTLGYLITVPAPFLFGGQENLFQWTSTPYNLDVNCNGTASDQIVGLNIGTTFSSTMPLPVNIRYTWITSNLYGTGQDGLVETPRQWLYSGSTPTPATADTLLLTIDHIDEPNNVASIVRGMDEPSDTSFAYDLPVGQSTKGFITPGMNWDTIDKDIFRLVVNENGSLDISITGSNSGIDSLVVFTAAEELARKSVGDGTNSVVIDNATISKTYYVYIRGTATGSTYLNPYTISASLATTLSAPTLSSPSDSSKGISINPTSSWNASSGAISYQLQVSNNSTFATVVFDDSTIAATSKQVGPLDNNTTYYWRVNASNASGTSAWSSVWNFTTWNPPLVTTNPATNVSETSVTLNGTVNPNDISTTVKFQWGTTTSYGNDIPATPSPVTGTNTVLVSATLTGLSSGTTYNYRVVATNNAGTTNGANQTFTTTTPPPPPPSQPSAPTLASPADGATKQPINPISSWNISTGATSYQLQVSTDSTFSMGLVDQSGIVDTSYSVSALANNMTYYWRVNASNSGGTSSWSSVWSFRTVFAKTDFNGDGKVNIVDFTLFAKGFGKSKGQTGYDERFDLNRDDKINIVDFTLFAKDFGKTE